MTDEEVSGRAESGLRILLIEDDREYLGLFEKTLSRRLGNHDIHWTFDSSFENAVERLQLERFDIVATDIWRDRRGVNKANLDERDAKATEVLAQIRGRRFTPVVAFSDGSLPTTISTGPFLKFADKVGSNREIESRITELIETGVPEATKALHDEL